MLLPPKGYRRQNFNCCETCKHSMDEEGYLECYLSIGIHEGFEVNLSHLLMCPVRPTAICDSFQREAMILTDEMIKKVGLKPRLCECEECERNRWVCDSCGHEFWGEWRPVLCPICGLETNLYDEETNDNDSTKGNESKEANGSGA